MLNSKHIAVFVHCVGFDELDAAQWLGFESQNQAVLAILKAAWAGQAHGAFVRGPTHTSRSSHQTCLCQINTLFGTVHQDDVAARAMHIFVFEQFHIGQACALCIKSHLQKSGLNFDGFGFGLVCVWCTVCWQRGDCLRSDRTWCVIGF